jgi:hypothetical protein
MKPGPTMRTEASTAPAIFQGIKGERTTAVFSTLVPRVVVKRAAFSAVFSIRE